MSEEQRQEIREKCLRVIAIIRMVITAKSKFKAILRKKYTRGQIVIDPEKLQNYSKQMRQQIIKQMEEEAVIQDIMYSISKIVPLRDLHYVAKKTVAAKMKIIHMVKGQEILLPNYPKIDFTAVLYGRLDARWNELGDVLDPRENFTTETLFVTDYLDEQRLAKYFDGKSLVGHTLKCISETATIATIDRQLYQNHFREKEEFSKWILNDLIWNVTPRLDE